MYIVRLVTMTLAECIFVVAYQLKVLQSDAV